MKKKPIKLNFMKYNFEILRTYSTIIEIEAETEKEAISKLDKLDELFYPEELEQCNIIEEVIKGNKYARKCTCCGNGMNNGYFANDEYFCSESCLRTEYTYEEWQKVYEENNDNYYFTEWEDEFDYQYQIINGTLEEIN
jgi:hypothetical protein